jgi:NAD(P)-dependent dehydrogenase (short-subunit alcohol dehydrogenase family)
VSSTPPRSTGCANKSLIDYTASKGAVLAVTYSLAQSFQDRGIRVNSVALGPVWTPLIPSTFPAGKVEKFGQQFPMGRAVQPDEIAPPTCPSLRHSCQATTPAKYWPPRRRDAARLTPRRPSQS